MNVISYWDVGNVFCQVGRYKCGSVEGSVSESVGSVGNRGNYYIHRGNITSTKGLCRSIAQYMYIYAAHSTYM